jgi:hypothetical protein
LHSELSYKRLEAGVFKLPEELTLLLNGLEGTPRRNWFRR